MNLNRNAELIIGRTSQLSRLAAKVIEKQLQPKGITFQEFRIAGLLIGDDDITQKMLAEKLSVRPATLSVAISKLEQRGIVSRVTSTTDKRVNYLTLTPNSDMQQMHTLINNLELTTCDGISDKDLATTGKVLSQIIENLNEQLSPQSTKQSAKKLKDK